MKQSLVESGTVMISNREYSAFPVDVISIKHKVCVLVIPDPTLRLYDQRPYGPEIAKMLFFAIQKHFQ